MKSSGRCLGMALIVLSTVLYLLLLFVPFAPLGAEGKVALGAGLIVVGEASFWVGGLLLGREVVRKYRDKINPLRWFRRDEP
ncbi:MAG: transporter suffix domain-containing protein [Chloroflexota bacterium]